ncbi:MAG: helix-turn-helix domain-containing protein [Lachnospiraceae bacterium]|nr:helix-turn-helix domain-containing protein [Lachnospiraceae bacterium]
MRLEQLIAESLEYIDQNLEQPIDLEEICDYVGYSKYYFSRKFKEYMGLSVMEYVRRRRLAKASDEIISGRRILDIALSYGWQSHNGFTKAFRQEYGFSPSLLRGMSMQIRNIGGNVMEQVFLRQIEEHTDQETLYSILKEELQHAQIPIDLACLDHIYSYACRAYKGIKRYSGDPYITHTLNTAIILAQMETNEWVIMAGLICDLFEKTAETPDTLPANIDPKLKELLIRLNTFNPEQAQWEDEEVIMVKLAQRLHNMRTIVFMKESARNKKAKETLQMFLPIAEKLGNQKLSAELNNLSLKYLL